MMLPRAFTIAFPVAPWPLEPMKSTLGGPHLRTLVLQSGAVGDAGIDFSRTLAKLVSLSNPILSIILSKLSSNAFETPLLALNACGSGQFKASQSRTFVKIFANLIAFENVALGSAIPPPWILFNCENKSPIVESIILLICPNMSLKKFSIPQTGTSKTWPIIFSKLLDR